TAPEHKWNESSLQFKNPDGAWGNSVNLKGERGNPGFSPFTQVNSNSYFLNGKLGINDNNPKTELDINGIVRLGRYTTSDRPACLNEIIGSLIFDTEKGKPFVCDGVKWKPLDSDFDSDGIVDWNDENDFDANAKHANLKTENIKSGVNIFGVTGNYSEKVGFGIDALVDVSGLKIITNIDSSREEKCLYGQHRDGNYHYFLSLVSWETGITEYAIALICRYNVVNNEYEYFESNKFYNTCNAFNRISICNNKFYFILSYYNSTMAYHKWIIFDGTNFSEIFFKSESKKYTAIPCTNATNNSRLYINNREWNQKVECNIACNTNCGECLRCSVSYRMFLISQFE
ncbi:hypothetical protein MHK_006454, partial [Candidatus Magnetomorum sp. HK-1]